jgi:membrane-associated phospholipid phosphatase
MIDLDDILVLFLAGLVGWIGWIFTFHENSIRKIEKKGHLPEMLWVILRQASPVRRASMVLILGLMAAILAGGIFGVLAEDVLNRELVTVFDAGLGRWLLNHATPEGSQLFFAITTWGSISFLEIGVVIVGLWLLVRRRYLELGAFLIAMGGGVFLNQILKNLFLRPRPAYLNAFYQEPGYSFPSGHAMTSIIFYGMLAYLLIRISQLWRWKVAFAAVAALIIMLIGFSRLYLGVHFLTDVLGGWAAGIAWLATCIIALEALHSRKSIKL